MGGSTQGYHTTRSRRGATQAKQIFESIFNYVAMSVWDTMYEKYGDEMNMTKEQFYEMPIDELEQLLYADEEWVEGVGWVNTKTGKKIEQ